MSITHFSHVVITPSALIGYYFVNVDHQHAQLEKIVEIKDFKKETTQSYVWLGQILEVKIIELKNKIIFRVATG